MDAKRIGTGIEGLDRAIDGLRSGDTVLWQIAHIRDYIFAATQFVAHTARDGQRIVYLRFGDHDEVIDAQALAERGANVKKYRLDPTVGFETFAVFLYLRLPDRAAEVLVLGHDGLQLLLPDLPLPARAELDRLRADHVRKAHLRDGLAHPPRHARADEHPHDERGDLYPRGQGRGTAHRVHVLPDPDRRGELHARHLQRRELRHLRHLHPDRRAARLLGQHVRLRRRRGRRARGRGGRRAQGQHHPLPARHRAAALRPLPQGLHRRQGRRHAAGAPRA